MLRLALKAPDGCEVRHEVLVGFTVWGLGCSRFFPKACFRLVWRQEKTPLQNPCRTSKNTMIPCTALQNAAQQQGVCVPKILDMIT